MSRRSDISKLIGQTITSIEGELPMIFTTSTGKKYQLIHHYDCCESVYLQDVIGDLTDLLGSPITMAEEVDSSDEPALVDPMFPTYVPESYTWTFYKLATIKGYVTLRFFGESNGYYSESVDFEEIV